jgi:hypothetical protein
MYDKHLNIKELTLQKYLISDYNSGGSRTEKEPFDRVKARKSQRIPVSRFILLFAAIVLIILALEYFI